MKHICFYSGGIGSWAMTKRVIARHGLDNVVMLFTDTMIEDKDLYRFLLETTQEITGINQSDLIEMTKNIPEVHYDMNARKRYLIELAKATCKINPYFVWIADGRDPWEVFKDVRWIGNSRTAQCSHKLKQEMAANWIEKHFKSEIPEKVNLEQKNLKVGIVKKFIDGKKRRAESGL